MYKTVAFSIFMLLLCLASSHAQRSSAPSVSKLKADTIYTNVRIGEQPSYFELKPEKKSYYKITVRQKGIDVVVYLRNSGGKLLKEVDTPNGAFGNEIIVFKGECDQIYHLEIKRLQDSVNPPSGNTNILLEAVDNSKGETKPKRQFSKTEIIKDIDYAIDQIKDVHPDLFANVTEKQFMAYSDSVKQSLPASITDIETYILFRKLFSRIQDGHTNVGWGFLSDRKYNLLFSSAFPYKLKVEDNRLFIQKNYLWWDHIPVGSEILTINGKSAQQCINEVCELISYESFPFRNHLLQMPTVWALWNRFNAFELTYSKPGSNEVKHIKTHGRLLTNIRISRDLTARNKMDYSFEIIHDSIGYMAFNSFNNPEKFKKFLTETFTNIQQHNIRSLIIDIRKNGGGNSSLGDELMQYISPTDFSLFDSIEIKLSRELKDNGLFVNIDSSRIVNGNRFRIAATKTPLRENPLRFRGNCYLMVSGNTFSSAVDFACAFKCYGAGKVVGTETGGLTVSFGDIYRFRLPNTKIIAGVSFKKFFNACGVDNRQGLIPDYTVQNSVYDENNRKDSQLEFTLNLINNKLQQK